MRVLIALCACAVMSGCGGGGGEHPCMSYCGTGCERAAECGYMPSQGMTQCRDSCFNTTQVQGVAEATCSQATEVVGSLSCAEFGRFFGLTMLSTEKTLEGTGTSEAAVNGEAIGRRCGTME